MRLRVSIVLLFLLMALALLNVATPDSVAQDAVTEESTLSIDDLSGKRVLLYNLNENNPAVQADGIRIEGNGFVEGAKVEFVREEGGAIYTITPSSGKITFLDSTALSVNLPLSVWRDDDGNLVGVDDDASWEVRVTNPDGHTASLKDAFTIRTYRGRTVAQQAEADRQAQANRDEEGLIPGVSGCVIVTAAYGSDRAPEVQFLRGFRDQKVLSTFAGRSFNVAFNSFYYSWSPGVADSIRENEEARAFTRGMIVPLLGVMSVSYIVYELLSFSPELGVTLTFFIASSMLGAIYLTLPMIALLRLVSRSMRGVIIRKGIIVLLGLSATGFGITSLGVYALSSSFAIFGTATLVVSAMFATALIVSSLILALAGPTYLRINSMWHVITHPIRARKQ